MFGVNQLQKIGKTFRVALVAGFLLVSLSSCGSTDGASKVRAATPTERATSAAQLAGNISEVSPPEVIQQLRQFLEVYQPQVKILNPQPDEVLQDDTVSVQFQVQDVPLFKNSELDMGPHLHVIVDNQPYMAVYDANRPLVLSDLTPGTHTLRVFASRPWHESFKNEGAYAQTTFHIFTKTDDNNPDSTQPILTYSRPKGSYGAEPILLDFYLTNAPIHLVAQQDPNDKIADWRIRCTINGSSFAIDRWEPIYLTGFKPGKNWVQLEFIDEQGNSVKNVFNNTARVITYERQGKDSLSKLVRGELSADVARAIVDPNYTAKVPEATPTPIPEPVIPAPPRKETPEVPATLEPSEETPEAELEPKDLTQTTTGEQKLPDTAKPKGFFNRFRQGSSAKPPTPAPEVPPEITTPQPQVVPETEPSPALEVPPEITTPQPQVVPETEPSPALEVPPEITTPQPQVVPEQQPLTEPKQPDAAKPKGFFNRFRQGSSAKPPTPEVIEPPTLVPETAPDITTPQLEVVPETEPSPVPESQPLVEPEEKTLEEEPAPLATPKSQFFKLPAQQPRVGGYFNRFRRPQATPTPSTSPTLPEIVEPEATPTPENSEKAELVPTVEPNQSAE